MQPTSTNFLFDSTRTKLLFSSWAFISPLLFDLSRALLGAWRFGLFRCVYSSFHNRLDLIREPAFYWMFFCLFVFPFSLFFSFFFLPSTSLWGIGLHVLFLSTNNGKKQLMVLLALSYTLLLSPFRLKLFCPLHCSR